MVATASSTYKSYLTDGSLILSKINWQQLKDAFEKSDYFNFTTLSLEDACAVIAPFVPQAGIAEEVVKLLAGIVNASPKKNEPIDIHKLVKSVAIAEGIDWNGIYNAMMGHDPFVAASTLLEDIAKIITPFIAIPSIAIPILSTMVVLGKQSKPESFDPNDPWMINQRLREEEN